MLFWIKVSQLSLYLKIRTLKNSKFVNCTFIIHKNGNKTSVQPSLKSNSSSFMFNKKFCEMGKKVIHWGVSWGNGGTIQIASWKCNLGIYLDIQEYYLDIQAITILLCLLLVLYVFVPSIYSFSYLMTTLLKSEVFQHSKAYSSHSFQPTGIGLGSLWRGNRCVLPIISADL